MSTSVRSALIPAAGLGTRFLPASKAQPKEMIPVVDKPAIQYVVEEAVGAGLRDLLIVTGRGKKAIEDHFDRMPELEAELEAKGKTAELAQVRALAELAEVHFVRQREPRGLGHAVAAGRHHVGTDSFAVLLADDLMDGPELLADMIGAHERTGLSVLALLEVPDSQLHLYGNAVVSPGPEAGLVRIDGLVEKPKPEEVRSNLAVIGRYVFTPAIFDCIDRTPPGRGGEIQITDAVALLAEEDGVLGLPFTTKRFDTGDKLEFLKATVELALRRDDLGPPLRAWLQEHLARGG